MELGQSLARSTRLAQMQHFLHTPGGLTTLELARLCGVCHRTIQRDMLTLQSDLHIPVTKTGDRYSLISGYILPPVSFSLFEAVAIFLASRLVFRQTDEDNPHTRTALQKLMNVLPVPLAQQTKEVVRAMEQRIKDPHYVHIFEQVALAWGTQRRMRLQYQSLQSAETKEWILEPYFVDVTGTGYSSYVIGHASREGKEGIITFKLDRIKKAEVLEASFEVPEQLSLEDQLGSAWGIVWSDETEVKLRFSSRVARRVRESQWHQSQTMEDQPDGSVLLTVRVGGTLEVTPWIRGWGPDVEVLAPETLRSEFRTWASQLYEMYR